MNNIEQLKKNLIDNLSQFADNTIAERNLSFHKNRNFSLYGIETPVLRKIMKQFRPDFLNLSLSERLSLASDLFTGNNEELGHIAIFILNLSIKLINKKELEYIGKYPSLFTNWSITDNYALNIMQPLLLKYKDLVLPMLEKWSKSALMWERRISMVTFTRKIGSSGAFTEDFLKICDILIHEKEDIVRKAVGWALKDNMRGNKIRIMDYIISLRQAGVSSTIILYAIRDIKDKEERNKILKINS